MTPITACLVPFTPHPGCCSVSPFRLLSTLYNTLHPAIGCGVFWLSNVLALSGYLQGLPPTDPTFPEDLQTALFQLAQYAMRELLCPIKKVGNVTSCDICYCATAQCVQATGHSCASYEWIWDGERDSRVYCRSCGTLVQ